MTIKVAISSEEITLIETLVLNISEYIEDILNEELAPVLNIKEFVLHQIPNKFSPTTIIPGRNYLYFWKKSLLYKIPLPDT